jgi:hypothetical protein
LVEDDVIPPNAVPFGEDKNGPLYIARALLEVKIISPLSITALKGLSFRVGSVSTFCPYPKDIAKFALDLGKAGTHLSHALITYGGREHQVRLQIKSEPSFLLSITTMLSGQIIRSARLRFSAPLGLGFF